MSAGSGVTHSEFNPSTNQATELYQIWMTPNKTGGEPRYAKKELAGAEKQNGWTLLFSGDGGEDSTLIRQNAQFLFGRADAGTNLSIKPEETLPHAWIQVVSGALSVANHKLGKADGLRIENLDAPLHLIINKPCSLFLFRLSDNS